MKVDENCMRNLSLGFVYSDRSSLLSAFIRLKYHKKAHLPNFSACGVNCSCWAALNCGCCSRFLWLALAQCVYSLQLWLTAAADRCRVRTLSHESRSWIHIWSEESGLGMTSLDLEARVWTWSQESEIGVGSLDLESGVRTLSHNLESGLGSQDL